MIPYHKPIPNNDAWCSHVAIVKGLHITNWSRKIIKIETIPKGVAQMEAKSARLNLIRFQSNQSLSQFSHITNFRSRLGMNKMKWNSIFVMGGNVNRSGEQWLEPHLVAFCYILLVQIWKQKIIVRWTIARNYVVYYNCGQITYTLLIVYLFIYKSDNKYSKSN